MVCFPNNKFILVSTSELALPVYVKDILEAAGMEYKEVTDLEEVIGELDVLYMTRIQKERFASEEEYQSQSGNYILIQESFQWESLTLSCFTLCQESMR